jgi:hypothetical protein
MFGRWWRRQSPARQDRFATLAPLVSVLLFLAAIISAFWYLRNEEFERETESVKRDTEVTQQQIGLRLIQNQEAARAHRPRAPGARTGRRPSEFARGRPSPRSDRRSRSWQLVAADRARIAAHWSVLFHGGFAAPESEIACPPSEGSPREPELAFLALARAAAAGLHRAPLPRGRRAAGVSAHAAADRPQRASPVPWWSSTRSRRCCATSYRPTSPQRHASACWGPASAC